MIKAAFRAEDGQKDHLVNIFYNITFSDNEAVV